ncbi:hypothetical protein FVER53263_20408 [Fusarium verticillioides]|nr:hypothetical protein FVER53263_20408 [Fusarium verticillioides]
MLDVNTVLALLLNPNMQTGIHGMAISDVPFLAADIKFPYVELRLACTLDVETPSKDPTISRNGINTLFNGRNCGHIADTMGFTISAVPIQVARNLAQDQYAPRHATVSQYRRSFLPRYEGVQRSMGSLPLTEEEKDEATKGKRWDNTVET